MGGSRLFASSVVSSLAGFLFWFVLARIVGVGIVGDTSAVISAAGVSATLISAGLNFAVIREVAARGSDGFVVGLLVGCIVGLVAGLIAIPLTSLLGLDRLSFEAGVLAFFSVLGVTASSGLIGFSRFGQFFIVSSVGALIKLVVGIALGLLGYLILAPILGMLAFPVTATILSLVFLRKYFDLESIRSSLDVLPSFLKLTYSNYANVLSNRLLTMLGVYLFAFLVREPVSTGSLYISLMVFLATMAIPGSILNALLPIATRKGSEPYLEAFRVGLGLTVPVLVLEGGFAGLVLWLIHPDLVYASDILRVLLISAPPLVLVQTVVTRFNQFLMTGRIALLGLVRLCVLLGLLPLLVSWYGLMGAGLAFLLANVAGAFVALFFMPGYLRGFLVMWGVTVLGVFAPLLTPWLSPIVSGTVYTLVAVGLLHVFKAFRFGELVSSVRLVFSSIRL